MLPVDRCWNMDELITSLQRGGVLKWFYSPWAVGTPLSEVNAHYRVQQALLVGSCNHQRQCNCCSYLSPGNNWLSYHNGNLLWFIESLHHNYRLQSRVTVSFSNGRILLISCNTNVPLTIIPVFNLNNILTFYYHSLVRILRDITYSSRKLQNSILPDVTTQTT